MTALFTWAKITAAQVPGRYMSFFSLSQGAGRGIAPLLGGLLNDNIGPKAIWYGGGLIGLASTASFAIMGVYYSPRNVAARKAAQSV